MAAVNYKETIEIHYDQYVVKPSVDGDTIAEPAGRYKMKWVLLEYYDPNLIKNEITREFPQSAGWVIDMPQPTKQTEEVDMLHLLVHGVCRVRN